MKRWKKILIGVVVFLLILGIAGYVVYGVGEHEGPGVVHPNPAPPATVADKRARQEQARTGFAEADAVAGRADQILFGDLHVHTTFSVDAFLRSLPLAGGEGAHPPADACDFARYCSSLDFFALTDHAEGLTPRHWQETKESVRQCNAVAGDGGDPDVIAFTGWEWSHVGQTPDTHYGHKNVIFKGVADEQLPTRPIGSAGLVADAFRRNGGLSLWTMATIPIREFSRRQRYLNLAVLQREILAVDACRPGVDVRQLPAGCRDVAETPAVLFEKLAQWGHDVQVIPHGTTWGFYTPPGYTYDRQLVRAQHDPERQRLIEVFSGHGNSEEYRPWRAIAKGPEGPVCPAPTADFEPCCHRAGELIRARCGDTPADECEARVAQAKVDYMAAGAAGHNTIPGATVEDWGQCGQCTDCFEPSFSYRPGGSAQYILARGDFQEVREQGDKPHRVRLGFMASSDNHSARPGTGYKEFARRRMTEAAGPISAAWRDRLFGSDGSRSAPRSRSFNPTDLSQPPFRLTHLERQASFFMTGGLIAAHSAGRSRDALWQAMERREVYGTSGPRILLWFDLQNGPEGARPMGSEVALGEAPRFTVRAAGSFVQKPGCPDWVGQELSPERITRLCAGECYHPGDQRHPIDRIEVVRIRPQQTPDEDVATLIDDPWRTFPCEDSQGSCQVTFQDPEFVASGRENIYYVRAIQPATPAVNGDQLRCQDESCETVKPCYGDYRTPYEDDCMGSSEERAWSSPIYVEFDETAAAIKRTEAVASDLVSEGDVAKEPSSASPTETAP